MLSSFLLFQINAYCIKLLQHQLAEVVLFQRICNSLLKHRKCRTQITFLFANNIIMSATIPQVLVNKCFVGKNKMLCCKETFQH